MKNLVVLGSTGSIGTQTLDVVRRFPEKFCVKALAVNRNVELLAEQVKEFEPEKVVVFDEKAFNVFEQTPLNPPLSRGRLQVLGWMKGLIELVEDEEVDIVMNSLVGQIWVVPTRAALKKGKIVALANKETIVVAGEEMKQLECEFGGEIRSVDSEHSAIWQVMRAGKRNEVKKIWLTCSWGPFRDVDLWPREKLKNVTWEQAVKHPTWNMGRKISIDSATLANKGLEVIEARYLFDLEPDQIEVIVHPQSIVHSAVEFYDGSIIAEMGATDMRRVIAYALFGEERVENNLKKLNLFDVNLTFERPDRERFPCLALAEKAVRIGQEACAAYNAANEEAVDLFVKKEIGFYDIPKKISEQLLTNN